MPKKSKKRCFHGSLFWRSKQESQEGASESAQSVPKRNDPESNPDNIQSEAECLKES